METFAALVSGDPAFQDRLGPIAEEDAFVAAAIDLADAHGVALGAADLRSALRPHPPGITRFMPAPVMLDRWPAGNWVPARGVPTGGAPAFDWLWVGADRLVDPFFEETVRRFEPLPLNRLLRTRTSMAALIAGAGTARVPEPSGFIHHMSRCGSTLIAQMLAADPAHIVLSEPEPLDAVLRWTVEAAVPRDAAVTALRAIIAALGRSRTDTERAFVKHDSWHATALPLLRTAFPATPWAFVYRDPVEVLVSQMHRRGVHTVPGMLPVGFLDVPDAEGMAAEDYAARSLAAVVEAALSYRGVGGGIAVCYRELPAAVSDRIASHFGLRPDAARRAAMALTATRDAKEPARAFAADSAAKHRAATPAIEAAARAHLAPFGPRLAAWRAVDA